MNEAVARQNLELVMLILNDTRSKIEAKDLRYAIQVTTRNDNVDILKLLTDPKKYKLEERWEIILGCVELQIKAYNTGYKSFELLLLDERSKEWMEIQGYTVENRRKWMENEQQKAKIKSQTDEKQGTDKDYDAKRKESAGKPSATIGSAIISQDNKQPSKYKGS